MPNASASDPARDRSGQGSPARDFTLAAFNAHWGIGRFGAFEGVRFDVAQVVRGFGADVVVVPEAWRDANGVSVLHGLEDDGYRIETTELMRLELRPARRSRAWSIPLDGTWDLAICSRFPVLDRRLVAMGRVRRDPPGARHALALTLAIDDVPVEVIGLHTSSKFWRLGPIEHLLTLRKGIGDRGPQVLAGDFNFWGPPVGAVMRGWDRPVRGRTFPANRPHSQIDHVLVRGGIEVLGSEVLARTPSDHRPIRTRLRLPDGLA